MTMRKSTAMETSPEVEPAPTPALPDFKSALLELVETYHKERCNSRTWRVCQNDACVKVQGVLQ